MLYCSVLHTSLSRDRSRLPPRSSLLPRSSHWLIIHVHPVARPIPNFRLHLMLQPTRLLLPLPDIAFRSAVRDRRCAGRRCARYRRFGDGGAAGFGGRIEVSASGADPFYITRKVYDTHERLVHQRVMRDERLTHVLPFVLMPDKSVMPETTSANQRVLCLCRLSYH